MVEAQAKGIFKGFKVGSENVEISHLQFADDALFLGEWSAGNAENFLHLLRCFGDASGLIINLAKSKLSGIVVSSTKVVRLASRCRCSPDNLPFHLPCFACRGEHETFKKLKLCGKQIQ